MYTQQISEIRSKYHDWKLWVVKCYGLILQPMARTNHKFPITALQISHATTVVSSGV